MKIRFQHVIKMKILPILIFLLPFIFFASIFDNSTHKTAETGIMNVPWTLWYSSWLICLQTLNAEDWIWWKKFQLCVLKQLRLFLAATAALEVQMLVCVCPSQLLQLYWTSEGLWTLWSTKFTSLQVASPRSSRLVNFTNTDCYDYVEMMKERKTKEKLICKRVSVHIT